MKYLLTLFLAANCFAGWQDEVPQACKGDTIRTLAWLGESVAWSETTIATTNSVPADPVKQEQAAAAWDMAVTAQAYGATNATKLANLYVMEGWANAAANEVQRDGILRDASRMAEIENNLTRNLGDWRVALTPGWGQSHTNITTETVTTPTRYRWQDHGFERAPTNNDLERR
jgi:hypothetical protein